jgi:hypothetical protein|tara:strand:- start:114 stop:335 length:222 start_codon:yes stop_codon:yes gene_type:complete
MKLDIEIDDHLDLEVGDSVIVIKKDGSVGKVILPEMTNETQHTAGYKKMLEVLEVAKPGSKADIIKHNRKKLH